jgi:tetratricopeptide (TPR) repeat protein
MPPARRRTLYQSPDEFTRDYPERATETIPPPSRALIVCGGTPAARRALAATLVRQAFSEHPGAMAWVDADPAAWPFTLARFDDIPSDRPLIVWAIDVDRAFPASQTGGTRLVLTQPTYLVQKLMDRVGGRLVQAVLSADEDELLRVAMEAFKRRGPFESFEILRVAAPEQSVLPPPQPTSHDALIEPDEQLLRQAFRDPSPLARLESCRRAAALRPASPVAWLALGSASMELQRLEEAAAALDRAAALAPDLDAVHFERGKLWLRLDDIERACDAFARAGELMPTFAAAFSNLGAALGELDRADEALAAFRRALAHDPLGYTILNNMGVVLRDLGELESSEAALRRVIDVAPEFVFGHYNLGHTLFLQGRFAEARDAYIAGQERDPDRNARQACRLAMCRIAAGDPGGALRDLQQATSGLDAGARLDLYSHAQEILHALLTADPALPGGVELSSMIASELDLLRRD